MNKNEDLSPRQLVRVAQKIREKMQSLVQTRTRAVILRAEALYLVQAQAKSLRRQLQITLARGWDAAADRLARRIALVARDLPMYAQNVEHVVEARRTVTVPSVRCLLADLQQLKEEMDGLRYQTGQGILAVTTEPITLEGVYLGPFEVQLCLNSLARDEPYSAYEIVALDPQPAGCNSDVTHPHVSDQRLCAGDAVTPIGAALSSGRVCDFFLLVRSVLTTYNSSSPYVSLDNWYGTSCHDCAYSVAGDDSRWCTSDPLRQLLRTVGQAGRIRSSASGLHDRKGEARSPSGRAHGDRTAPVGRVGQADYPNRRCRVKIEIVVSPQGETRLETKGFAGASCQEASRFIESALGEMLSDRPTAERYQVSAGQTQNHERT